MHEVAPNPKSVAVRIHGLRIPVPMRSCHSVRADGCLSSLLYSGYPHHLVASYAIFIPPGTLSHILKSDRAKLVERVETESGAIPAPLCRASVYRRY